MKTLHKIFTGLTEAYIWADMFGGNGARISKFRHAMRGQRGTPPPVMVNARYNRRYWAAWGHPFNYMGQDPERILNPLCGRLKSRSRWPMIRIAYPPGQWQTNIIECPDCTDILATMGEKAVYQYDLIAEDPWSKLNYTEREQTIDPISGT